MGTSIEYFFKGEAAMIVFALLHAEGELRLKLLGANTEHFFNRAKAVKWHNDILYYIEKAECSEAEKEQAAAKAYELKEEMVEYV